MYKKILHFYNTTAAVLLIIGIIAHYTLPIKIQLLSDAILFLAVFSHSRGFWGSSRTITYFFLSVTIGYLAEFIGVHTGWVFGPYHYNPGYQELLFGVPLSVPILYVVLLYAGNFLCVSISRKFLIRKNLWALSLVTACVLTLKDVITDPLQSTVEQIWIWDTAGSYFGVPIQNFFGWFIVFFIMTFTTISLSLHKKTFIAGPKIHEEVTVKNIDLIFPLFLFFTLVMYGITEGYSAPDKFRNIGNVSMFIAILGFTPYFLLAWFINFKKDVTPQVTTSSRTK